MSPELTRRRSLFAVLLGVLVALVMSATATAQEGEGVQGILRYQSEDPEAEGRVPIEGGVVVVYEAELSPDGRSVVSTGDQVGEGTSNAEGQFSIDLPGPGDYAVELQVESLPEGVALVDPERQTLPLRLTSNQRNNVLFNLAEGEAGVRPGRDSDFDRLARLTFDGIKFGLIIGLCAVGLSLIYGTTGLVNFAHGEMITLGAVFAFFFNVTLGIQLILATLIAMVVGGLFGAALDRGLWLPLRKRGVGLVAMMIISIGLAIFLRYLILYQFGDRTRPYDHYAVQTDSLFSVGPVNVIPKDFVIILVSLIVLIGVALILRRTKLGKAMRAVSDNPDLASSTGIDVNLIVTLVWFMAGVLVTLGGVFQGISQGLQWTSGTELLLLVFAGVTLGGLGTDFGAMVGSLIVGVLVYVSTLWIAPELKNVGALFVLILILMVRPQGIFGRKERIG